MSVSLPNTAQGVLKVCSSIPCPIHCEVQIEIHHVVWTDLDYARLFCIISKALMLIFKTNYNTHIYTTKFCRKILHVCR